MIVGPRVEGLRRRIAELTMRLFFRNGPASVSGTSRNLPKRGIHRVLICRPIRSLGNTLMLTPLLRVVAETWPDATIDLVHQSPMAGEIYAGYPSLDQIIQLPVHPLGHPLRSLRALRQMRRTRYDLAIDPDPRSQSGRLLVILARKRRTLGFSGPGKSGALTYSVDAAAAPRHEAMSAVYLLRGAAGEGALELAYPRLAVRLGKGERQRGQESLRRLLGRRSPVVHGCIGFFADATRERRFDHGWWSRFLSVFEAGVDGYACVEIVSVVAGRSLLDARYPCFYSPDVRELASVLANLALFVSADCGVMHLASAAGVPTIGLFKATDASRWGLYGGSNCTVDAAGLTPEQTAAQASRIWQADHESVPLTGC